MPTLLLRLAAPLQAWGCDSRFEVRKTESNPTKSGVIGMLAAALGWKRDADLSDLNALKFGIRVDQKGVLLKDYHTVHGEKSYVTNRYYLSDAIFLAGLEGENRRMIEVLENAIRNPGFPLFLGRRSCPPTLPIFKGIRECSLEDALRNEPLLTGKENGLVRIELEADRFERAERREDLAISFHPNQRLYGYRKVKEYYIHIGCDCQTGHDAMAELE